MNVYYIKGFKGHYPVGTSAVIVAVDRLQAFQLLAAKLKQDHSIDLDFKDVNATEFKQLDLILSHAVVLQDGNY